MITKILLASDGSESSLRAAQVTGEIAQKYHAEVLVTYVALPIPAMLKVAEETGASLPWAGTAAGLRGVEQAGIDILARTTQVLDKNNIPYTTRLEFGHPAMRICELTEEAAADLIVIGQHGVQRAASLFPENIAERVSSCAACSVLIVR